MAKTPRSRKKADARVNLRSVVLCDQIRTEDNGKHLLIGVYDAGMSTDAVPALFTGVCYGVFEITSADVRVLEYRIHSPGAIGLGRVEFNENVEAGTPVPFVAPFSFIWERPGEISLDWQTDGSEWSSPVKWGLNVEPDARRLPKEQADRMRRILEESRSAMNESGRGGDEEPSEEG